MGFCENLKELRKINKLDQKDFAKILNISPKTISHWETGYTEPSISQLIAIANYFDVTLDDLVDRKYKLKYLHFLSDVTCLKNDKSHICRIHVVNNYS